MAPIPPKNPVPADAVGKVLVEFALKRGIADPDVYESTVSKESLAPALAALEEAKTKLEAEISTINNETAPEVNTWLETAKAVEEDVKKSRRMAEDIEQEAQMPQVSGEAIWEAEQKVEFLAREMNFKERLRHALESIKGVNELLEQVEVARNQRRILDSLHLLENAKSAMDKIFVSRTCRAMKLLDVRVFELTSDVHRVFEHVWDALVHVDTQNGTMAILESHPNEPMNLSNAVEGLESYDEVDKRMTELWHDVDKAIIGPRTDIEQSTIPGIVIEDAVLSLCGTTDNSVSSLFADLEKVFSYFSKRLPPELVEAMSSGMMPELVSRIITVWLDSAVPSSLQDMDVFEEVITSAREFCAMLEGMSYSGYEELEEWVDSAPKVWLTKCRETALDSMRRKLAGGLGESKEVERVERQMVTREEGRELAAASAGQDEDAWDAAWSDDGEGNEEERHVIDLTGSSPVSAESPGMIAPVDDGYAADAWGWGDNDGAEPKAEEKSTEKKVTEDDGDGMDAWGLGGGVEGTESKVDEKTTKENDQKLKTGGDDETDAWGWGYDAAVEPDIEINSSPTVPPVSTKPTVPQPPATKTPPKKPAKKETPAQPETVEITLRETYHISSMPDPVLTLIHSLLSDAATLTSPPSSASASEKPSASTAVVAPAAAGLFALPTLALAMFRAIGPYYYSLTPGGSMYLYNDATYLSLQLQTFITHWATRTDLTPRAKSLLRLDTDVKTLRSFAARAYSNELAVQKIVVRDLMGTPGGGGGGGGNFFLDPTPADADFGPVVAHVRSLKEGWKGVLARSVLFQALGAIVDVVARKIVGDVGEMGGIGADDAEAIATVIEGVCGGLEGVFVLEEGDGAGRGKKEAGEEAVGGNKEGGKDGGDGDGDDEADAWGWGEEEPPKEASSSTPSSAPQFVPTWLRLKFLSQFLQSNLNDIRFLWFESELSLHFTAEEIVDLIGLSFESNARTKEVVGEIEGNRFPLQQGHHGGGR